MWSETKRKAITLVLERVAEEQEAKGEDHAATIATHFRQLAAGRVADERYHVTLRHLGSPERPFLLRELNADTLHADHEADKRARAAGATDDRTVAEAKARDSQWQRDFAVLARRWLEAGLENGEAEFVRLLNLGGPDLLIHAMREVQAFQEVTADVAKS